MMRFALSKGRLLPPTLRFLHQVGLSVPIELLDERRLTWAVPDQGLEVVLLKPADVPICVASGAADFGIVGLDQILEQGHRVLSILDLRFGLARFVLAVPQESPWQDPSDLEGRRIATKYPRLARMYLPMTSVEIVPMHGSVEIAPRIGLADAVFDLSQTGQTLRVHRLRILAQLGETTARLIVSRRSFKLRHPDVRAWIQKLQQAVEVAIHDRSVSE